MTGKQVRSSRPERPHGYYELRRVIAANMRDQRQRRGWSLKRVATGLAPYLGQMGASTISAWENSRTDGAKGFTVEEIYALCRIFEVTIADLLEAPRILDIGNPIEQIAGEDTPEDIAKVFGYAETDIGANAYGDRERLGDSWRRYSAGLSSFGPVEPPF